MTRSSLRLLPICPNPARIPIEIGYELGRAGCIRLEVFDVMGRRRALLADGWSEPGAHRAIWHGPGGSVLDAAAGVYFVRLSAAGIGTTRGLCLIR